VDFFGIASTGFVKMVRSSADGSDVTIELFGPGQIFGLCGAICGMGCPLTAVAVTDMWYLRVPKRAFLDIYNANSVLKDRMVRRLTLRLQNAHNMISHLCGGRVEERIAAVLFMLTDSYGQIEDGKLVLKVPMTRQEISEMAGTTVESTIRTMSRWQKDGLVSTDHHYISIIDKETLWALIAR
jgi:CRP/FNR family transcriptional regulator